MCPTDATERDWRGHTAQIACGARDFIPAHRVTDGHCPLERNVTPRWRAARRFDSARTACRQMPTTDRPSLRFAIAQIWQRYLLLSDVLLLVAAVLGSYALRMEGMAWGPAHTRTALLYLAFSVPLKILLLHRHGVYQCLWRHSSYRDLERLLEAMAVAGAISVVLGGLVLQGLGITPLRVPLLVLAADWLLFVAAVVGPRLLVRRGAPITRRRRRDDAAVVLIAGAGDAGKKIVTDLMASGDLRRTPV